MNIAHTIFGVFGNATALFLFLSPSITFKRIIKNKSTEQFSGIPYPMTLLNCLLSAWYGLPFVSKDNTLVTTINGTGAVIEIVNVLIFLVFSPKQERAKIFEIGDKDKECRVHAVLLVSLCVPLWSLMVCLWSHWEGSFCCSKFVSFLFKGFVRENYSSVKSLDGIEGSDSIRRAKTLVEAESLVQKAKQVEVESIGPKEKQKKTGPKADMFEKKENDKLQRSSLFEEKDKERNTEEGRARQYRFGCALGTLQPILYLVYFRNNKAEKTEAEEERKKKTVEMSNEEKQNVAIANRKAEEQVYRRPKCQVKNQMQGSKGQYTEDFKLGSRWRFI
ncbi:unnamed protein product [Arabis nemorensis]|uniref:Bidirectional sugar transporter SWEET n=1 Tax=Arabis nemorensis TaxID=586526 RepID=A0A565B3V1_9BRAS|nr:unnamed protein product [Arabis nemorensis]